MSRSIMKYGCIGFMSVIDLNPFTSKKKKTQLQKTIKLLLIIYSSSELVHVLNPTLLSRHSFPAVYLYFSDRARAKAARNLSRDTWASGVKSPGNLTDMTTRMQWASICEKKIMIFNPSCCLPVDRAIFVLPGQNRPCLV